MTRKDYVLIAEALKLERVSWSSTSVHKAIDSIANDLASQLAEENPRFDRARFLAACGAKEAHSD